MAVIGGQASRFLLLGRVEVWCSGRRVELGRRRERGLLGVLLLEVNRVVSAERLMDLLWDGSPPDSARPSLYAHVSRLRAALEVGGCGYTLDARDGGYVLEADPQLVDAHRFTALVARARGLDDPGERVAVLREALALWRGPVLADAGSELLGQRVAADLAELRSVAWELALDADLERGRHGDVIGEVSRLVGDYPLREGLWARLALALYRAGRQGDALAALARAREWTVETLGVEPGPDVREMQRRILAGDPGLGVGKELGKVCARCSA